MKLQLPKGMRDFGPEEKILRDKIVNTLKYVFELYGYVPLETPIVERYDVLSAKFAAGQESDAMKETFKLKDQGKRELGLRFDLTVPFARYVAMNPNLKMPFKRYQIGEVFRDGPIKLGRYREFWQLDADLVGSKEMLADAELIKMTLDFFKRIDLDVEILVNNRRLLEGVLTDFGISKKNLESVIIVIDKLDKIGLKGVKNELKKIKINDKSIKNIISYLNLKNEGKRMFSFLDNELESSIAKDGWKQLKEFYEYFDPESKKSVTIDVSLARGFSYYTGTVFEGYVKKSKIKSSVCGGGRYDDMIGNYIGKGNYPAVGISFGLDVISEIVKLSSKEVRKTNVKVYVISIKTIKESIKVVDELRKNDINTDIDLMNRDITKNLDYANKLGIPYVIFFGQQELNKGKLKLRDMNTGKEYFLSLNELINKIKDQFN